MNYAKSVLIAVIFILCAFSTSAQTVSSDTLGLKIVFERPIGNADSLIRDSVLTLDEFLSLIKKNKTESVDVRVKLEGGLPSSEYVHRDSIAALQKMPDTVIVTKITHRKREWKDRISQTPMFAVRTNALAMPFLNFGVEVPIGKHWSVGADYYYPWIWRGGNYKTCNQLLGFDIEGRYWFSDNKYPQSSRLLGHSVGAYVGGGYYDFERNWKGHQGEFFNIGVDYMYALPLFNGLIHLEFELGLGYIYSRAVPYKFIGQECYLENNITRHVHWAGPTRAQVSVVLPVHVSREQWGTFCGKVSGTFHEMFDGEGIAKVKTTFSNMFSKMFKRKR